MTTNCTLDHMLDWTKDSSWHHLLQVCTVVSVTTVTLLGLCWVDEEILGEGPCILGLFSIGQEHEHDIL